MASITKRNGRYIARVRRRGTPLQAKTFNRVGDARRWASEVERKIDLGHLITNDCTVSDLLRRYGQEITPTKQSACVETYVVDRLRRSRLSIIWLYWPRDITATPGSREASPPGAFCFGQFQSHRDSGRSADRSHQDQDYEPQPVLQVQDFAVGQGSPMCCEPQQGCLM